MRTMLRTILALAVSFWATVAWSANSIVLFPEPVVKVEDNSAVFMPYIDWLSANSDLQYHGEPLPRLRYVSQNMLQTIVFGPDAVAEAEAKNLRLQEVIAAYDEVANIIYVKTGTDVSSFDYGPTMVHELYHFLQMVNKVDDYGCLQNLEQAAYEIQTDWMDAHNHPEERPNMFFIYMLVQSCHRPPWD